MIQTMMYQRNKASPVVVVVVSVSLVVSLGALGTRASGQEPSGRGPLDGMIFEGIIGPRENPDRQDELHFNNGRFWSAICVKCGFEPGEYWVRYEGEAIHFRGELTGERGTFTYRGIISDDKANVSIDWRKERWYWTIEREMAFRGELAKSTKANLAQDALRLANEVGDTPPAGCL